MPKTKVLFGGRVHPALQIQCERLIQGRAPPQAFAAIHQWLLSEGATVRAAYPPYRIEAAHGRSMQMFSWREDGKKTLVFELAPSAAGTTVRATAAPTAMNAPDIQMRFEVARENWGRLLDRLWARFGPAAPPSPQGLGGARPITTQTDWEKAVREAKKVMLFSPAAGVGAFLGIAAMSAVGGPLRGGLLYGIPTTVALLAFVMSFVRYRDARRGQARSGGPQLR